MSIITWRNITQPTATGAGILMNSAQQGIDRGFNTLQNVLAQRNKTEQENWQTQKANNTSDYLDAVQGITDPTQVQDPAVQANLAKMKQQFGYQVDSNLIRGAMDKRVSDLQVQGTNRIQFNDLNRVDSERDAVDQIGALYQAGKYAEGDALRQGQNFRDDAALDELRVKSQRGYSQEGRAQAQDGRAAASHGLSMATGQVNLESNRLRLQDQKDVINANDTARQLQTQFYQDLDHINSGQQAIAAENGIDVNNMDVNQAEFLKQKLAEAGVPPMQSTSQYMDQAMKKLLQTGAPPAVINNLRDSLSASIGSNDLTERDQAYVNETVAAVGTDYDQKIATNASQMEKIAKTNTFLKSEGDPYEQQATLQAAVKKAASAESEQEELSAAVQHVMSTGVRIDGVDYEVPQGMALAAINYASNQGENWLSDDKDADFIDAIKSMAADPKFLKQWEEFDQYNALKKSSNTLALEKNTAVRSTESKIRSEVGGTYNSVEALNRNLLNRNR